MVFCVVNWVISSEVMLPFRAMTSTAFCFAASSSFGNSERIAIEEASVFIKPSSARWERRILACCLVTGLSSVLVSSNDKPLKRSGCKAPNFIPVSASISFCSFSANSAKLSFAIMCNKLIFLSSIRSPFWFTGRRKPRPTFCRAVRLFF